MPTALTAARLACALAASILVSVVLALPAGAAAGGPLDAYLPKSGKIVGHVMKLGVAPEDQVIDRQFRVAVQGNMEWFKKYVQAQKPGKPLPYDKRMGITEAQYEKLQHMKADFHEGEPIEIEVTRKPDGQVAFASTNKNAAELAKVTFAPDEKAANTPYGALAIFNEINQTNASAPIGVWKGAEWARMAEPDSEMPSAKIAFGKRQASGEGVMYYQVAPHKDHREQSLVVFYKLD